MGKTMDRPIAYDKLAREDRFVRMRTRDVANLKIDQGLPPFPDIATRESMRDRVHDEHVEWREIGHARRRHATNHPAVERMAEQDHADPKLRERRHGAGCEMRGRHDRSEPPLGRLLRAPLGHVLPPAPENPVPSA